MSKAERLLSRMREAKSGWSAKDLESLYLGFGFEYREAKAHRFYFHPDHPQLCTTVARHSVLAVGFVVTAVKLIDQLIELESHK